MKLKYKIIWYTSPRTSIYVGSKLLTGISRLLSQGTVSCRMVAFRETEVEPAPNILWWDVEETDTGRSARIAIDLADSASVIDAASVKQRTHYFKMSYVRGEIAKEYSGSEKCVFLPLGLIHKCLDRRAFPLLLKYAHLRLRLNAKRHINSSDRYRNFWQDLRWFVSLPPPSVFENRAPLPESSTALFQTRTWPPEESTDDLDALNRERVEIVRALKAGLGSNFVGGIRPDWFSLEQFPDVVLRADVHRRAYARITRGALIGVYSRGVHHSLANKLSEYLAAGLCIVSEPLIHQLPVPLEAGKNYIPFETPEECVSACRQLLEDRTQAELMRRSNLDYYKSHVAPDAHVLDILQRTFAT